MLFRWLNTKDVVFKLIQVRRLISSHILRVKLLRIHFSSTNMSYENSSRYFCCGIHVHLLVLVLAIIGIILTVASSVASFGTRDTKYASSVPIFSFLCYTMLIIANRKKIWILHVIYMILKVSCIDISDLF
jgi:hypothetical protein